MGGRSFFQLSGRPEAFRFRGKTVQTYDTRICREHRQGSACTGQSFGKLRFPWRKRSFPAERTFIIRHFFVKLLKHIDKNRNFI
jgi:hypothetical protein